MQDAHLDAVEQIEATPIRGSVGSRLSDFLLEAGDRVRGLGPEFDPDGGRLDELRQRLHEQRCYLAVLGQFKRGKSTLINALLGAPVLPAAVVPLTSIPTFLTGGEQLDAQVIFDNGMPPERFRGPDISALAEFLSRYVTESANPRNRLGVRQVEVTYPASLLRQGLVLIDTPGIGSTFRHNTEATVNFLPQCDAALFVVPADPPITEVEVEFLKLVRQKLARVFFILNKVDYLDAEDLDAAAAFLQRVLCEQVGFESPPPIFLAWARQGLAARQADDATAWQRSGLARIEQQIVRFLLTEKAEVLERALSRQTGDILADVQRRLELILHSLRMPLVELDARIRQFEENLVKIDEQRIVALERVRRDEERLANSVKQRVNELLPRTRKYLQKVVQESQDRYGARWSEDAAREAIAAAIPAFFEHEFGAAHQACNQELQEALSPHRRHAAELIASVYRLVEKLFDIPAKPEPQEVGLAIRDRPCWRTHKWAIQFGSIPVTWIDRLYPRRMRHARIRRRIMEQVEYLVTRNVGDLRWSMLENLKQSIDAFRRGLDDGFQRSIRATRGALEASRHRRTEDSAAVDAEMIRLASAVADLERLREGISRQSNMARGPGDAGRERVDTGR